MQRISDPFSVIPAPHQVRDKRQAESSIFNTFWTPAFAGVTVFGNIDDFCNYAPASNQTSGASQTTSPVFLW